MNNILRIFLLFTSSILSFIIIIQIIGKPPWVTFKDIFDCYQVLKFSIVFTLLSIMFPYAYLGVNQCNELSQDWLMLLLFTSFIILPVGLVFHPGEKLYQNFYLDRSEILWPYFLVWFFHGVINAWFIRKNRKKLYRRLDENYDG